MRKRMASAYRVRSAGEEIRSRFEHRTGERHEPPSIARRRTGRRYQYAGRPAAAEYAAARARADARSVRCYGRLADTHLKSPISVHCLDHLLSRVPPL